jgi:hypothetical protein
MKVAVCLIRFWLARDFWRDVKVAQTIAALMQLAPDTGDRTPVDADFGRAARLLRERGIRVVVADPSAVEVTAHCARVRGWEPRDGRWRPSGPHDLVAVYNRLPARHPERAESLLSALQRRCIPVGNPARTNRLALDKGQSLRLLAAAGTPVPEVETSADRFELCLQSWGTAFRKPRFGSFGRGVARVHHGDPLPTGEDADGPAILQRAVQPPAGPYAGVCIRGLAQRDVTGTWRPAGRVARVSDADPVVNVARGAAALPLDELALELDGLDGLGPQLDTLELAVVRAVEAAAGEAGAAMLELGMDWVLDPQGAPWLIEINGKPGGRLRVLARRGGEWLTRHEQALAAPFRRLAAMVST